LDYLGEFFANLYRNIVLIWKRLLWTVAQNFPE
jgi:hypothetical protein